MATGLFSVMSSSECTAGRRNTAMRTSTWLAASTPCRPLDTACTPCATQAYALPPSGSRQGTSEGPEVSAKKKGKHQGFVWMLTTPCACLTIKKRQYAMAQCGTLMPGAHHRHSTGHTAIMTWRRQWIRSTHSTHPAVVHPATLLVGSQLPQQHLAMPLCIHKPSQENMLSAHNVGVSDGSHPNTL